MSLRLSVAALVVSCILGAGYSMLLMAEAREIAASKVNPTLALPYTMLYDEGGFIIHIAIPAEADLEQLRATLAKAADDHQDDRHRDYMWFEYLFVTAYLAKDGEVSKEPAGHIRRYVPPIHPDALPYKRREHDSFLITLDEARTGLR